jgi:hypothetical protein
VFSATVPDANPLSLDLELYVADGTGKSPELGGKPPKYAVLTMA